MNIVSRRSLSIFAIACSLFFLNSFCMHRMDGWLAQLKKPVKHAYVLKLQPNRLRESLIFLIDKKEDEELLRIGKELERQKAVFENFCYATMRQVRNDLSALGQHQKLRNAFVKICNEFDDRIRDVKEAARKAHLIDQVIDFDFYRDMFAIKQRFYVPLDPVVEVNCDVDFFAGIEVQ